MKPLWIKAVIVCVVIAVVIIFTYSGEATRSYMLLIINVALLQSTEDTPDYIDSDGFGLYFRNSISLRTLRDAIKSAEMGRHNGKFLLWHPRTVYVGKQEMGGIYSLYWQYPYCTRWIAKVDSKYEGLIADYVHSVEKNGEGFGMSLEMSRPSEEAKNIMLSIIDTELRKATKDTPDYIDQDGRLHFQNSISLQTLHDALTGTYMSRIVPAPNAPTGPVYVVGEQEIGYSNMLYYEYDATWWVHLGDLTNVGLIRKYTSQIEENGEGFGLYPDLPEVTDDPYLLSRLVADLPGRVVVIENGKPLFLSQPLAEGKHELSVQRFASDARVSDVTHYTLIVDSHAEEL